MGHDSRSCGDEVVLGGEVGGQLGWAFGGAQVGDGGDGFEQTLLLRFVEVRETQEGWG